MSRCAVYAICLWALAAAADLTPLEQRIGAHPVGEFAVDIERPEAALFRIALSSLGRPERTLLVTVVYRAQDHRP